MKKDAGRWLLRHTRGQLPAVVLLSVLNMVTALAYLWLALLSKELIEAAQILLDADTARGVWECLGDPVLLRPTLTVVGVVLGQVLLHIASSRLKVYVSGKLEMRLRERVFDSLLHTDYMTVGTYHSGELITRLTSDITQVSQGVTGLIPSSAALLAKLVGGLVVLYWLAPDMAAVLVVVGILAAVGSRLYGSRLKKLHKCCQEAYGKTRSFMQEGFTHLLSVKAFTNENAVVKEMNVRQNEHFRLKLRRNRVQVIGSTGMYILMSAAYYAMLLWCVFCLVAGSMTVGTLTALLQIFEQLQAPLRGASGLLPQYYAILASAERLQQLDELTPETGNALPLNEQVMAADFKELALKNVSFSYGEAPVLDGVDLTVRRGECVALVGASGIGKSTLMKLILAIHPCDNGSITVTGDRTVDVCAATRRLMAYVPQANSLISGTIRENIAFFRNVTDEEINNAVQLACLTEFVASLPDGVETVLGENGLGVSEGQAQRIAVARALVKGAPILLLDECTSALDAATEEQLLRNLHSLNDRAVLLISHKDTTVAGSDCVWRLADGKINKI